MFDPHRIGPRRSSSYARNKGRVIQRRLVDTPSPGYTRTELEELVPLMRKNGFIPEVPPPPSPNFGKMVSYSVIADGLDISNNYRVLTATEIENQVVTISSRGAYLLVVPNYDRFGYNLVMFRTFRATDTGDFGFVSLMEGTRLYSMGADSFEDNLVLVGENGTSILLVLDQGNELSTSTALHEDVGIGGFAVAM